MPLKTGPGPLSVWRPDPGKTFQVYSLAKGQARPERFNIRPAVVLVKIAYNYVPILVMRVVTAFLLTALIALNLFGFYALFFVRQAEVKTEMSETISRASSANHHEVLTFSKTEFAELAFNDNGNEFRLNGRLYDVVSIENAGATVSVIVEYDSKETALMDAFGGILSQQQDKDQNSSPLKTVISHFQQDYVPTQRAFNAPCNVHGAAFYLDNHVQLPSPFAANKLTPPPQFFLV